MDDELIARSNDGNAQLEISLNPTVPDARVVNESNPLAVELVALPVVDPGGVNDKGSNHVVPAAEVGVHDIDANLPRVKGLLVHVAKVHDETLIEDAREARFHNFCVLLLSEGFDVNNRVGLEEATSDRQSEW